MRYIIQGKSPFSSMLQTKPLISYVLSIKSSNWFVRRCAAMEVSVRRCPFSVRHWLFTSGLHSSNPNIDLG